MIKHKEMVLLWKNYFEGPEEKPVINRTIQIHNLHLFSYARAVAETANLGLASTATQDDVPQQTLTALFHSRNWLMDTNHFDKYMKK